MVEKKNRQRRGTRGTNAKGELQGKQEVFRQEGGNLKARQHLQKELKNKKVTAKRAQKGLMGGQKK